MGELTNCAWSYSLKKNIGFALISTRCAVGDAVDVFKDGRTHEATLVALPFI